MRTRRRGVNGLHSVHNGSNAGLNFSLLGWVVLGSDFCRMVGRTRRVLYYIVLR